MLAYLIIAWVVVSIGTAESNEKALLSLCITESLISDEGIPSKETVRLLNNTMKYTSWRPSETRTRLASNLARIMRTEAPDSIKLEICSCLGYLEGGGTVALPVLRDYVKELKLRSGGRAIAGSGPSAQQAVEATIMKIERK